MKPLMLAAFIAITPCVVQAQQTIQVPIELVRRVHQILVMEGGSSSREMALRLELLTNQQTPKPAETDTRPDGAPPIPRPTNFPKPIRGRPAPPAPDSAPSPEPAVTPDK